MASYRPKIKIDSAGNTEDLPLDAETLKGKNIDYFATSQDLTNLEKVVDEKQDKLNTNQLNAVNSGITQAKVTKYDGYEELINSKPNMSNVYTKVEVNHTFETKTDATSKLNKAKDHTTTEVSNLKKYTDEQFKKINDNLIATVDCSHKYEITGNTGDEHGLAIDDQQMLIKKIQGHSRRKSLNLLKDKSEYVGTVQFSISKSVLTINGTTNLDTTWFGLPVDFLPTNFVFSTFNTSAVTDCDILFMRGGTPIDYIASVPTNSVKKLSNIESISIRLNGNGKVFNNVKIPIMINEGTSELPFQPYDNTLVNSNNTLISTGRNLVDISNPKVKNNKIYTTENRIVCTDTRTITKIACSLFVNDKYISYFDLAGRKGNKITEPNSKILLAFYPSENEWIQIEYDVSMLIGNTIYVHGEESSDKKTITNFRVVYKNTTDFEPYKQDVVQTPMLGEFDYYQEGKIYRQTSQVINIDGVNTKTYAVSQNTNGSYRASIKLNKPSSSNSTDIINNKLEVNSFDLIYRGSKKGVCLYGQYTLVISIDGLNTVDEYNNYLKSNPIQLVYKLVTPTIEDYAMPSGYAVYNGGLQIQQGDVPYTITKQYNLSQKAQILANIEVDREQQKQIDEVNNKIINLPSPSITNRTVKNISINNTFPQTLTPEQTKDVFNNDLFVILSVGGSQNFYEYKNVIENPSEGKTFINISPGMKDYASENVSFDVLYVESNGYIRKESFQINKFPVYQHSILITDEKDTRILCSIVAKKGRTISSIPDLKYLINASGLKVVCNGFVNDKSKFHKGMAFELNTQSGDVKVKYVDLNSNSNSIYDVALNSISNLKIIDTVYDYTEANG